MKNLLLAALPRICAPPPVGGFTSEDRMLFGVLPTWAFFLILAGIVMAAVIIIVEIFKRKMK